MASVDAITCSTSATATVITNVPETVNCGKLPSELFRRYHGDLVPEVKSGIDAESVMQRVLSSLATQEDLGLVNKNEGSIANLLWKWLTESNEEPVPSRSQASNDSRYEWNMGVRLVHYLLPLMTPFEVHAISNQAIVFTDGSTTHGSLCLLLCVYALRKCPQESPIAIRWKRWQSLVFETIRLYQRYGLELAELASELYLAHILPASQNVFERLPTEEAHHVAFLAASVGTIAALMVKECQRHQILKNKDRSIDDILPHALPLLEVTRNFLHATGGFAETWLWSNPWRIRSEAYSCIDDRDEEVEFITGRHDIVWWTQVAYRHEFVAGVDTSWDLLGISLLALTALDSRPMVLSSTYVWSTWFPHIRVLFENTSQMPSIEHAPLVLLENLLKVLPERSLPPTRTDSKLPDSPYMTFQHLSNRLLVRKPNAAFLDGNEMDIDDDEDVMDDGVTEVPVQDQESIQRVVSLMKSLLNRYEPVNQVKIVRRLVHDCPHPALKARFIDFLRPLIFEEAAADPLWTYIGSFVNEMTGHVDAEKQTLVQVDTLVLNVEMHVSVCCLIQLWCMVKHRLPRKIKRREFQDFYDIMQSTLGHWLSDTLSMPPDDYYRLYLLEGALQQVIRVLNETHKRKQNDGIVDGTCASGDGKDSGLPSSVDQLSPPPKMPLPKQVIVGDADLFS